MRRQRDLLLRSSRRSLFKRESPGAYTKEDGKGGEESNYSEAAPNRKAEVSHFLTLFLTSSKFSS
jgi:hypothetical protein